MDLQLTLLTQPSAAVEAEALTPDRLAGLTEAEIAALPVRHGNQSATIGNFFHVQFVGAGLAHAPTTLSAAKVDSSSALGQGQAVPLRVCVTGDLAHFKRVGEGMTQGQLIVQGNVGMHVGARMRGGEITVEGDAGDWAGAEMVGGRLTIKGNAGDLVGAAYRGARRGMLGGEIIVYGHAGAEVGSYMRRGLIAIGGNCGDTAGAHMLAGSIIVLGKLGQHAGQGMKRGSIIALQAVPQTPAFAFDCHYRPTYLRLYLRHLQGLGLQITQADLDATYERRSGDVLELGRGELLMKVLQQP